MKSLTVLIVLSAALFLNGNPAFAKIEITPSVTLKEEYNDNIFLTRTDNEYDYITTVSPNIFFGYSPNSSLDIKLNYGLNFRFYDRHGEFNDTSLKDTQNIDFQAKARPLNRFYIDVFDSYKRSPIDIREPFSSGNAFKNMTDSNIFTISPYVIWPLSSTITATFGYAYNNKWYNSDENADSEDHTGFLTLSKKLSSTLTGELKYDYYKYVPDVKDLSDEIIRAYDRQRGSVAVTYQATPDFSIKGELGRARYNYKDETDSRNDLDVDSWNVSADYNLRLTRATSLGAGYGVSLKDSPSKGAFKSRRADLFFKTGNVLEVSVNPFYSDDKYLNTDRRDKITGVIANIMYPLGKKIDILLGGQWERQIFLSDTEGDEKVRKYDARVSLDYKYSQKITASLGYKHDNRNSDNNETDFTDNIVSLQAKVVF